MSAPTVLKVRSSPVVHLTWDVAGDVHSRASALLAQKLWGCNQQLGDSDRNSRLPTWLHRTASPAPPKASLPPASMTTWTQVSP